MGFVPGMTIVYTSKGVSVERVRYDQEFWEKDLLPRLEEFYNKCVAPEIVCPCLSFRELNYLTGLKETNNKMIIKFCFNEFYY